MNPDCLCGHPESRHKWGAAECGVAGCGCNVFRTYKVASLPRKKYAVIETETGWDVYSVSGESGAFS